eukprot:5936739-Prymnesium_polylepis.2
MRTGGRAHARAGGRTGRAHPLLRIVVAQPGERTDGRLHLNHDPLPIHRRVHVEDAVEVGEGGGQLAYLREVGAAPPSHRASARGSPSPSCLHQVFRDDEAELRFFLLPSPGSDRQTKCPHGCEHTLSTHAFDDDGFDNSRMRDSERLPRRHRYSGPDYTFRGQLPRRTRQPWMRIVYFYCYFVLMHLQLHMDRPEEWSQITSGRVAALSEGLSEDTIRYQVLPIGDALAALIDEVDADLRYNPYNHAPFFRTRYTAIVDTFPVYVTGTGEFASAQMLWGEKYQRYIYK